MHHLLGQWENSQTCRPYGGGSPIFDAHLEVKDAFSKLYSLSGVRNCVVEATLCQAEHLRHTQTKLADAALTVYTFPLARELLTFFN